MFRLFLKYEVQEILLHSYKNEHLSLTSLHTTKLFILDYFAKNKTAQGGNILCFVLGVPRERGWNAH